MTEPIPCKHCGKPTDYSGTELCDLCWSVDRRVRLNPKLALKVLDEMGLTPKSEAEELLEWLNVNGGLLMCDELGCLVQVEGVRKERDNPLNALRAAREASDE